jgi:hypothetical protein
VLEAEQTDKLANELGIAATIDAAKYEWASKVRACHRERLAAASGATPYDRCADSECILVVFINAFLTLLSSLDARRVCCQCYRRDAFMELNKVSMCPQA